MRFLAGYIMRGRLAAILVAAGAAVGSLLAPPLSYISGAAVALVTLRLGPQRGLEVVAGATAGAALLALAAVGSAVPGLVFAGVLWLPVVVLGWGLRRSADPARPLWLAAAFGALAVAGIHGVLTDPAAWWHGHLQAFLGQVEGEVPAEALDQLAGLMTGAAAAGFALTLMGSLLLGRWWQALLYNPGGFRQEFHGLRTGRVAAGTTVVLLVLGPAVGGLVADLAMVAMALHLIQGLAVAHGVVGIAGLHGGWLFALYALVVIRPAEAGLALALGGLVDNGFDFRGLVARRLGKDSSGGT